MLFKSVIQSMILCLLVTNGIPGPVWATQESPERMFDVTFTPEGTLKPMTPLRVSFTITCRNKWFASFYRPVRICYSKKGKIEILDAPVFEQALDSGQAIATSITVQCAPNDTARITVHFGSSKRGEGWSTGRYFISDDTSVLITRSFVPSFYKRKPDPHAQEKSEFRADLRADSARYRHLEESLRLLPLNTRPPQNELEIDQWLYTPDFDLPMPPLPSVPILTRQEFFDIQRSAPTDTAVVVWVESAHFARLAGDSAFVPLWPGDPEMGPGHLLREALRQLPRDQEHSLVFYVLDGASRAALEVACTRLVYVGSWWRFQMYRGKTTFEKLPSLRQVGIGLWLDAFYPLAENSALLRQDPTLRERLFRGLTPADTTGPHNEPR